MMRMAAARAHGDARKAAKDKSSFLGLLSVPKDVRGEMSVSGGSGLTEEEEAEYQRLEAKYGKP